MGWDGPGDAPPCGLVYYSSASGNTARFVARLGLPALRIPIRPADQMPVVDVPFVLICPTYADGQGRGAVPKAVIHFLNDPRRRSQRGGRDWLFAPARGCVADDPGDGRGDAAGA